MSTDTMAVGAVGTTSATMLYLSVNSEIIKTAIIPVIGYGVSKLGEYYNYSPTINKVGGFIFLTGLCTTPGAIGAYTISALGGKTLLAKMAAGIVGAGITYKVVEVVSNFAAGAAANAIARVR